MIGDEKKKLQTGVLTRRTCEISERTRPLLIPMKGLWGRCCRGRMDGWADGRRLQVRAPRTPSQSTQSTCCPAATLRTDWPQPRRFLLRLSSADIKVASASPSCGFLRNRKCLDPLLHHPPSAARLPPLVVSDHQVTYINNTHIFFFSLSRPSVPLLMLSIMQDSHTIKTSQPPPPTNPLLPSFHPSSLPSFSSPPPTRSGEFPEFSACLPPFRRVFFRQPAAAN